MNDKEKSVEKALDDIFGSDFLEIDVNSNQSDIGNESAESKEDRLTSEVDSAIDNIVNNEVTNNVVANEVDSAIDNNVNNEITSNKITNEVEIENEDNNVKTHYETIPIENESKRFNFKLNRVYVMPIIIILLIVVPSLIYLYINMVKKEVCTYNAIDIGYKIKDKYEITYKKNKLIYIKSTYSYNALTDEFKKQVKYIKEEKLPIIINSNGVPGFTYVYDVSDNEFKVSGYIDFTLIDFKKIDNNDFTRKPLSYFKVNSTSTYKSFTKNLKDNGFVCKKG